VTNIEVKEIVNTFIRYRNLESRFETLMRILNDYEIKYNVETYGDVNNIIVNPGVNDDKLTVIGAHYDVYGSSIGINDNACAVAMLIKYAKDLMDNGNVPNIEIVFFDKEEDGGRGSKEYTENHIDNIKEALLFDIIGYGDELVASGGMSKITEMLFEHSVKLLRYALPSDNLAFIRKGIPVTLITAAPKSDLIDNGDLTYSVKPQADFYKTFHNQNLDNQVEIINFDTVNKAYVMLKELY